MITTIKYDSEYHLFRKYFFLFICLRPPLYTLLRAITCLNQPLVIATILKNHVCPLTIKPNQSNHVKCISNTGVIRKCININRLILNVILFLYSGHSASPLTPIFSSTKRLRPLTYTHTHAINK